MCRPGLSHKGNRSPKVLHEDSTSAQAGRPVQHSAGCFCFNCRGQASADRRSELLAGARLYLDGSGVDPGNTPPANLQGSLWPEDEQENQVLAVEHGSLPCFGGEDTLELACYVDWRSDEWAELLPVLSAAKERSRAGEASLVDFGGDTWEVMAKGRRSGEGKGPTYAFMLRRGGVTLSIARTQEAKGTFANVLVVYGSMALMRYGDVVRLHDDIMDTLDDAGGHVRTVKVSRVDCCTDHPGLNVATLVPLMRDRCYKSRGRALADFGVDCPFEIHAVGRKLTGFSIGRNILIRVYDKLEETRSDEAKRAMLVERRWGGKTPECATRVEFQIRRERLKQFGIDTFGDYLEKREELVRYVVGNWFVMTSQPVDPKHPERSVTHPVWAKVQRAFYGCFRPHVPLSQERKRKARPVKAKPVHVPTNGLDRQTVGCLLSRIAANGSVRLADREAAADHLAEAIREIVKGLPPGYVQEKLTKKQAKIVGAVPGRNGCLVPMYLGEDSGLTPCGGDDTVSV